MPNLNNLTSKIIEDAQNTANEIILENEKEEKKIIKEWKEKGEKEKAKILEKAQIDAANMEEKAISNIKLKVRNEILEAKQKLISKVFNTALQNLYQMSDDEYKEFIKNYILNIDIEGDEEILVENRRQVVISEDFVKEVNNLLTNATKKGELKLSTNKRVVNGGFILIKNGVEVNCTYESLLEYYRDELEYKIVDALFH